MRHGQLGQFFAAAVLATLAVPATAQNVVADHEQIASVMQEAGYKATLNGEGDSRYLRSSSGGYKFSALFYGCDDDGANCKTIQFYAGFTPKTKPSLQSMNDYAAKNRWGRIYLDSDGDPVIEMDIDLEDGGMSPELFKDNLEYWDTIMGVFAKFVFANDNG